MYGNYEAPHNLLFVSQPYFNGLVFFAMKYNMLQHLSEMQRNIVDHVEDASCCTIIMSKITHCICEQ